MGVQLHDSSRQIERKFNTKSTRAKPILQTFLPMF